MEDKVEWKDDKISHKGMKRKISELEARIVELEKRPNVVTQRSKSSCLSSGKRKANSLKYVRNVLDLKAEI